MKLYSVKENSYCQLYFMRKTKFYVFCVSKLPVLPSPKWQSSYSTSMSVYTTYQTMCVKSTRMKHRSITHCLLHFKVSMQCRHDNLPKGSGALVGNVVCSSSFQPQRDSLTRKYAQRSEVGLLVAAGAAPLPLIVASAGGGP